MRDEELRQLEGCLEKCIGSDARQTVEMLIRRRKEKIKKMKNIGGRKDD